ncbi:MAG: ABC transporter ATP-binding protein, partial [Clostridia bacterium]|nr:ABC transporter ATP-binding protein [Clostridia bacterium]
MKKASSQNKIAGAQIRKNRGRLLKRLWQYLGKYRLLIVLAVLLSACSSLLSLYGPKLSGRAINAITGENGVDFDTVLRCAGLMAVCYALSAAFSYLLQLVMIKLSRNVAKRMRQDVFRNLTGLPVSFFDNRQIGDIVSTITYDIDTVNQSLASDALQILQSTITVVVSLVMMLTIAPILVPIFAVTIPVTMLFTRWLAGRVRPMFRNRSKKLGELNGFVEEMLGGQKTIRAYGREDAVQEKFEEKNVIAVEAYTRAEANGTVTGPSVTFINNLSLALVCVFGSMLYLRGIIRLGDLSSFVQYSRKFSGPI